KSGHQATEIRKRFLFLPFALCLLPFDFLRQQEFAFDPIQFGFVALLVILLHQPRYDLYSVATREPAPPLHQTSWIILGLIVRLDTPSDKPNTRGPLVMRCTFLIWLRQYLNLQPFVNLPLAFVVHNFDAPHFARVGDVGAAVGL